MIVPPTAPLDPAATRRPRASSVACFRLADLIALRPVRTNRRAALCRLTPLVGALILAAVQATAEPTFAGRDAATCASCHMARPRLPSAGEALRPEGSKLPDDERHRKVQPFEPGDDPVAGATADGEGAPRVEAASSQAADLARLHAGCYTFGSQIQRGEGPWGDVDAGLTAEVADPFWPGWWLAALAAAATAALVSAAHRPLVRGLTRRQSELEQLFAERSRALESSKADCDRVVAALAAAVEAKDPSTEGHEQRVARLAEAVGRRLGISGGQLEMLRYAAVLHDVGKIGVPETILCKTGALTVEERDLVERHVDIGVEILSSVDILAPAVPFIRYHQERWDGRTDGPYPGYHGLKGEQIPLEARIIAVVDAFDAMASSRPYRQRRTRREALDELRREAGHQFDPAVVEAFAREYEDRWGAVEAGLRGDRPGRDWSGEAMPHSGGRRDRRHRRYDVYGVTGSMLFSVEVTILDISAGGMQVETASPLTVGRRDNFKLRREERTLQLQGKVAWRVLTGTARAEGDEAVPVYRYGIAFDRTLSEEGRRLVDFLQGSMSLQPEHRLFGRLRVGDERTATAELSSELAVRRLSLSGMLVESDLRPRLEEVLSMEVHLGETHPAVSGRVAYVAEDAEGRGRNQLGIEFLDLTEDHRAVIARFIEQELVEGDRTAENAEV